MPLGVSQLQHVEQVIASKNQNTFAKRQREIEKKRKAEEKLARRIRKNRGSDNDSDDYSDDYSET